MTRFQRLRIGLLLSMLSLVLTCIAIEVISRAIRFNMPPREPFEFYRTHPEPYQDADYWSAGFVDEMAGQPGGYTEIDVEGAVLSVPNNYEGQSFHVRDHRRVATGQPEMYDHTIYLYGGSTVYNREVPDEHTIASQLQALVNAAGLPYRVENRGIVAAWTNEQLTWLRATPIREGDLVVWYDGVNDVYGHLYYGRALTFWESGRQAAQQRSDTERWRADVYNRWSVWLATVDVWLFPYDAPVFPPHLNDAQARADLVEALQRNVEANVQAAHDYSQQHGARFVHLLQPHLFADGAYSDYETLYVLSNPGLVAPGLDIAFGEGFEALAESGDRLSAAGIEHYDLRHILNDASEEIWLDAMHVEDDGNRYIAQAIYNALFED